VKESMQSERGELNDLNKKRGDLVDEKREQ
jgi:hypothetical protein